MKQKMANLKKTLVNREISWLSFNERVLQEAANPEVPLIERLKFIGIFSSNQDEFFRVRVGTLQRMLKAKIKAKSELGATPKKILNEIHQTVVKQRVEFDRIFAELYAALEREKIYVVNEKQLNEPQHEFIENYFQQQVRPKLVPIMLNTVPQFPYLENQVIYLAIDLKQKKGCGHQYALIEVPANLLTRFVVLPSDKGARYVMMLDDVIRLGLTKIFAVFDFESIDAYTVKLTRDAELDIEDDVTLSLLEKVSESVRKRVRGEPVRFVYDREIPVHLLNYILEKNRLLEFDNLIAGGRYHNARDFMKFPNIADSELKYVRPQPLKNAHIEKYKSMFEAIRRRDILLHFPYNSFHYTVDLLREAAIDPKVVSISMTLYRVARNSNVVNTLVNAIRNGKKVNVLLELKARFDEEANIYWTQTLEKEGARLIEGVPGLKVHAKLCLITRREGRRLVRYAMIGTGNFNEETASIYSDHALFTANRQITDEVDKVFSFLKNNYKTFTYRHLIVSPFQMRKRFMKMIKNEIKNAKAGKEAFIYIKLNSLVDHHMIYRLYEASQAGVKIRMIIRGICSLVPAIPGMSDNIEATSIVDKYLEHSRVFIFCNDGNELFYLSSADWMVRNLDHRVEVAVPIYDHHVRKELREFMNLQFNDTKKARIINEAQDNQFKINDASQKEGRSQIEIYEYLKNAN